MTLWSIFRSPLMIGGNMPDNDEFTTSLITNADMIRVNQHSTNNREISFKDGISIWTADDKENPVKYMAVLNINDSPKTIILPIESSGLSGNIAVRDIWNKTELTKTEEGFKLILPAHGAGLLSLSAK